jgi:DNA/RNA endonuclease YhcR with UshA esterase domain
MNSAWLALPGILLSIAVISSACGDHSQPARPAVADATNATDQAAAEAADSGAMDNPASTEVPVATVPPTEADPPGVTDPPTGAEVPVMIVQPNAADGHEPGPGAGTPEPKVGETPTATDPQAESESLQELIPWARLDLPPKADITVDWTEAKDYVGQVIAVEGTVIDTYNSGRACFLNFKQNAKDGFYLAILGSTVDDFQAPPEGYFLNKKVRAIGRVAIYKGRPQIVIESNKHLRILP